MDSFYVILDYVILQIDFCTTEYTEIGEEFIFNITYQGSKYFLLFSGSSSLIFFVARLYKYCFINLISHINLVL